MAYLVIKISTVGYQIYTKCLIGCFVLQSQSSEKTKMKTIRNGYT